MNDLDALVTAVLANLDAAGVLADWLQEHDREREAPAQPLAAVAEGARGRGVRGVVGERPE